MNEFIENRLRELIREELRLELTRYSFLDSVGEPRTSVSSLKPVLQLDDAEIQRRREFAEKIRKVIEADIRTLLGLNGVDVGEEIETTEGGSHRVGCVVDESFEPVSSVVDVLGHHSSPSSVGLSNHPSVGGGIASGDELRAHTSDATHPDGDAT